MSHNAILKWIGQLVNVPEGATIKDLSDGRILTNLLNKLNPELYPQKIQSSPQKNFQMDMLCISNLVQNLKQAIPNFPEINCLLIAKHQDLTEILKLLAIIIKIMIESQAAQEAILKLSDDSVQNILQFVNQYQEEENGNILQSDRRLLDKIDELEEENQKLKQLLEQYDQQLQQSTQKLKFSEQFINQKESEITELKQQIQKNLQIESDISGSVIEKLKSQLNLLNKDKKELSEQNKRFQIDQQKYKEIEQINQQLQQELVSRSKQDKIIEELKTNFEIQKQQQDIKDQKIQKLQEQLKLNAQNQQKECSKTVELEMVTEQLRQEIEDIQRLKHKEIYQLQQKITELTAQIDQFQQERIETQRSSVHYQQSPRCLDSEFKSILNDNISGYYPEQTIQEFQQQLQLKEQQLQQREILFEQKVKTLEAKITRERDLNLQHLQITSQLQEDNKKLKQELDKLVDTNYQVNRIQAEKQQNMLLISVIECLNEKINQLYTQQKEQLKSDKKIQPQILSRNSISLWSAKQ